AEHWRQLAALQSQAGEQRAAAATLRLAHEAGVGLGARDLDNLVALQVNAGAPWQAARLLEELMAQQLLPRDAAHQERLAQLWTLARDRQRAREAWAALANGSNRADHWLRVAGFQLEDGQWQELLGTLKRAQSGASAQQRQLIRQWEGYAQSALDNSCSVQIGFHAGCADPVAGGGHLAFHLLHPHLPGNPERLVQRIQRDAAGAAYVHYLVRGRRRHMDAGTEPGHQQELLDLHGLGDAQRHYVTGQADVAAIEFRHYRRRRLELDRRVTQQLIVEFAQRTQVVKRFGHQWPVSQLRRKKFGPADLLGRTGQRAAAQQQYPRDQV